MKPVYVDIHIHTSEDANRINENYNVDALVENVNKISGNADILLSLSDHNTINKKAYLELKNKIMHIVLSAEIHIRKYEECSPYHCHILFNVPINEQVIDELNGILDKIYPDKCVKDCMENIPTIETISNEFDGYDFLLLPHGGQSHRTFDKAMKKGKKFDTTLEKSIYYNQFDGFTARSSSGLEGTIEYFKRLGIHEFVNLLTCSDNYDPLKYPEAKSKEAEKFTPTWMFATPTFSGLRLSLSESTRLVYSDTMPKLWNEFIGKVIVHNKNIDIDVNMTPGLNVVIGGSSSGKTLFVDSIYRKLTNNFENCPYMEFGVDELIISNPSGIIPHYINQNFIISILQNKDKDINDIPIIEKVFPMDEEINSMVRNNLYDFKMHLNSLVDSVKELDALQNELKAIPMPNRLIISQKIQTNIMSKLIPNELEISKYKIDSVERDKFIGMLVDLQNLFSKNEFAKDFSKEINDINNELLRVSKISDFAEQLLDVIKNHKTALDVKLISINQEDQTKNNNRENLIRIIGKYVYELNNYEKEMKYISKYNVICKTKEIHVRNHRLSIENSFTLTQNKILEVINGLLKTDKKISDFDKITPENLFKVNFRGQNPKVKGYDEFIEKLYEKINELNKKKYKIITSDGQDFDKLSPGWKSAVILDLILGYDKDCAPIIIDQPEDNLATSYINKNLIKLIKEVKMKKQIILVSHNATIPMLGDAQNVILCKNEDDKILICSQPLEGDVKSKSIVDYIAEITDGGKPSIKKRVKKYNLKTFKEEN